MIRIQNLTIHCCSTTILAALDMDLPDRGLVVLLGPSGCGKTTLLRSLIREDEDDPDILVSGKVELDSLDLRNRDVPATLVRQKLGLVPQRPQAFPGNALDNVSFALRHTTQLSADEIQARTLSALAEAGLEPEHHLRPADRLSGGQLKRLAIARTIALDPSVLLMDEPSNGLDPLAVVHLERLMTRLAEQRLVVVVTHDLHLARRIADEVFFLWPEPGGARLIESGSPDQLLEAPRQPETRLFVEAAWNGAAAMYDDDDDDDDDEITHPQAFGKPAYSPTNRPAPTAPSAPAKSMTDHESRLITKLQGRNPAPFIARIPGSKSYTNRALLLAAMRPGRTTIQGGLDCDDTRVLAKALDAFGGISAEFAEDRRILVERSAERLSAPANEVHMGAAGTPARFMLAFAAAAQGKTIVTGTPRLCERPMDDIINALRDMGIQCDCLGKEGCLPVAVHGGSPNGRRWRIGAEVSSQFTSSLLLYASQQTGSEPVHITLVGNQVSRPYVEMTRSIMAQCGIRTERVGEDCIVVHPGSPKHDTIQVETDASGMSYFLALAAVTQTTVEIPGIGRNSVQGDVGLARAFADMGCTVALEDDLIRIQGGPLRGIDIDMETMPDVVLTLCAVAARATGTTRITNIANLRVKECDRIHAAAAELNRLGTKATEGEDFLVIEPTGQILPASVHTYDDHRVAMTFAILGLLGDGVRIEDPDCVRKSFPDYWREFERFVAHHEATR
jgi:3-phosphoshikimate 1-carboxyvinyltransferase